MYAYYTLVGKNQLAKFTSWTGGKGFFLWKEVAVSSQSDFPPLAQLTAPEPQI